MMILLKRHAFAFLCSLWSLMHMTFVNVDGHGYANLDVLPPQLIPSDPTLICEGNRDFIIKNNKVESLRPINERYCNVDYAQLVLLNNSNIVDFGEEAFTGMNQLKAIFLKYNSIKIVRKKVFQKLSGLRTFNIWLDYNAIEYIEPGAFDGISFENILLRENKITRLDTGTFGSSFATRDMLINNNEIAEIEHGAFEGGINKLFIERNKLSTLPAGLFELISDLKQLHILQMPDLVSISEDAFRGLDQLTVLDMSNFSLVTSLPDRLFDSIYLGRTEKLNLITDIPIPKCGVYGFRMTEEKFLRPALGQNRPFDPAGGDYHCNKLDLSSYNIRGFSYEELSQYFNDAKLTFSSLTLEQNNISCCSFYEELNKMIQDNSITYSYTGTCFLNEKTISFNKNNGHTIKTLIKSECGVKACADYEELVGDTCQQCQKQPLCVEEYQKLGQNIIECERNTIMESCNVCNRNESVLKCFRCTDGFAANNEGICSSCSEQPSCAGYLKDCVTYNNELVKACSSCSPGFFNDSNSLGICSSCKTEEIANKAGCLDSSSVDSCTLNDAKCSACKSSYYFNTESCYSCQTDVIAKTGKCKQASDVLSCEDLGGITNIKCEKCEDSFYPINGTCTNCKTNDIAAAGGCLDKESVKTCLKENSEISCSVCADDFNPVNDGSGGFICSYSGSGGDNKVPIIAGVICGVVLLIITSGIIAFLVRKQKQKDRLFGMSAEQFVMDGGTQELRSDQEYSNSIPLQKLSDYQVIDHESKNYGSDIIQEEISPGNTQNYRLKENVHRAHSYARNSFYNNDNDYKNVANACKNTKSNNQLLNDYHNLANESGHNQEIVNLKSSDYEKDSSPEYHGSHRGISDMIPNEEYTTTDEVEYNKDIINTKFTNIRGQYAKLDDEYDAYNPTDGNSSSNYVGISD